MTDKMIFTSRAGVDKWVKFLQSENRAVDYNSFVILNEDGEYIPVSEPDKKNKWHERILDKGE